MYKESEKYPYHSHIQNSAQKSETNVRLEALKLQESVWERHARTFLQGNGFTCPPKYPTVPKTGKISDKKMYVCQKKQQNKECVWKIETIHKLSILQRLNSLNKEKQHNSK